MCRKYTKRIWCYILGHQQVFVAAFSYSIYSICTGNLDTSTWPLPFNMIVPFDAKPIWGWYLLWFIQINCAMSYCICTVAPTSYFISCCLYIGATCDHLDFITHSINLNDENSRQESVLHTNQKFCMEKRLIEAVKHHSEILK